jgi:hypothetical protein
MQLGLSRTLLLVLWNRRYWSEIEKVIAVVGIRSQEHRLPGPHSDLSKLSNLNLHYRAAVLT